MTNATCKPVTVIGIGEDGLDGLAPAQRARVEGAEVLAGGARHLSLVPGYSGDTIDWSGGIDAGLDAIAAHIDTGRHVVVLASGDPLDCGVGKNLVARFGAERVDVRPHPGAVSLTCAALGWSRPDVQALTIHGRPLETIHLYLAPGRRLVLLSQDGKSPAEVAALLSEAGYGPSRITVCERLGGPHERFIDGTAADWSAPVCADLNTVAVELVAEPGVRPLSRLPGLPDDAYEHDGQLTKRFMRAVTLASLAPVPGETLWDLGAGAGSISIEWLRAHETLRAVAVERDLARAARIRRNAAALGVPRLDVVVNDSLAVLESRSGAPDAIFIGGQVAAPGLLHKAWARLKPGGRLVANAVIEPSRDALVAFTDSHGGECTAIAVEGKALITHYIGYKSQETGA